MSSCLVACIFNGRSTCARCIAANRKLLVVSMTFLCFSFLFFTLWESTHSTHLGFFDVQWCILMVKIIWTLDQWSNWTISSDLRIRIQLFQEIILVEILAGYCCCCCCFTGWFQKCDAMVMSQDFSILASKVEHAGTSMIIPRWKMA